VSEKDSRILWDSYSQKGFSRKKGFCQEKGFCRPDGQFGAEGPKTTSQDRV